MGTHALMHASENHTDLHNVSIWIFFMSKKFVLKGKKQPMILFQVGTWFSLYYYWVTPTWLLSLSGRKDSDFNF